MQEPKRPNSQKTKSILEHIKEALDIYAEKNDFSRIISAWLSAENENPIITNLKTFYAKVAKLGKKTLTTEELLVLGNILCKVDTIDPENLAHQIIQNLKENIHFNQLHIFYVNLQALGLLNADSLFLIYENLQYADVIFNAIGELNRLSLLYKSTDNDRFQQCYEYIIGLIRKSPERATILVNAIQRLIEKRKNLLLIEEIENYAEIIHMELGYLTKFVLLREPYLSFLIELSIEHSKNNIFISSSSQSIALLISHLHENKYRDQINAMLQLLKNYNLLNIENTNKILSHSQNSSDLPRDLDLLVYLFNCLAEANLFTNDNIIKIFEHFSHLSEIVTLLEKKSLPTSSIILGNIVSTFDKNFRYWLYRIISFYPENLVFIKDISDALFELNALLESNVTEALDNNIKSTVIAHPIYLKEIMRAIIDLHMSSNLHQASIKAIQICPQHAARIVGLFILHNIGNTIISVLESGYAKEALEGLLELKRIGMLYHETIGRLYDTIKTIIIENLAFSKKITDAIKDLLYLPNKFHNTGIKAIQICPKHATEIANLFICHNLGEIIDFVLKCEYAKEILETFTQMDFKKKLNTQNIKAILLYPQYSESIGFAITELDADAEIISDSLFILKAWGALMLPTCDAICNYPEFAKKITSAIVNFYKINRLSSNILDLICTHHAFADSISDLAFYLEKNTPLLGYSLKRKSNYEKLFRAGPYAVEMKLLFECLNEETVNLMNDKSAQDNFELVCQNAQYVRVIQPMFDRLKTIMIDIPHQDPISLLNQENFIAAFKYVEKATFINETFRYLNRFNSLNQTFCNVVFLNSKWSPNINTALLCLENAGNLIENLFVRENVLITLRGEENAENLVSVLMCLRKAKINITDDIRDNLINNRKFLIGILSACHSLLLGNQLNLQTLNLVLADPQSAISTAYANGGLKEAGHNGLEEYNAIFKTGITLACQRRLNPNGFWSMPDEIIINHILPKVGNGALDEESQKKIAQESLSKLGR